MKVATIWGLTVVSLGAASAHAQVSSTVTLASDYEFRGVSLSDTEPVLQASLDYAFANGFAIGAWASPLDYGDDYDGSVELDYYASYSREVSDTLSWSAGLTAYTYPGSEASATRLKIEPYIEGYVDITLGGLNAAQWYADDYSGLGISAQYTEVNYTLALPRDLSLKAHVGYSWGDYWEDDTMGGGELADFSLGLAYQAGNFSLNGKITGTDASGARKVSHGPFTNDARLVVSIETTFPWEK
jgi:uncharacterized protein (TIGR02001 family)